MTARVGPRLRDLTSADAVRILEITRATGVFREEELAIADEVFHDAVEAAAGRRLVGAAVGRVATTDAPRARTRKRASPAEPPSRPAAEPATEPPYFVLGAEFRRELVGWICWGRTPCTVGTWDLYWLAVDPAVQRHGVATMLIEEMERRLAGTARLVVIDTSGRPDYGPTREFYTARGYLPVARVPDFYAPGDDQIIFTKKLR
jgi:ribosomal protein S18 acetylase RimI-like enzyme